MTGPIWCAPAAAAQARKDASGRTFFIDHNTRATTWERPPAPRPCPSPPRRGAAPAAERGGAPGGDAGDGEARAGDAAEGESRAAAAPDDGGEGGAEAEAAAQPPKWGLFDLSVDEVGGPWEPAGPRHLGQPLAARARFLCRCICLACIQDCFSPCCGLAHSVQDCMKPEDLCESAVCAAGVWAPATRVYAAGRPPQE